MKYYKQQGYGCIAILFEDNSLEVYTLDGFKFISPQWYTKELLPIMEEISKKDFDEGRELIIEEQKNSWEKEDFEKIDLDSFRIPVLYHGTDKKMLRMVEDERKSYKSSCLKIIDYFYPLFKKNYYNDPAWDLSRSGLDKETIHFLYDVLGCIDSSRRNNELFQYPDNNIYLCSNKGKAKEYALRSFAGGEIGYLAYYLCKAVSQTFINDLNLESDMEAAVKRVLEFGNREKEPTVISLGNLKLKYLRNEDASLLTKFDFHRQSFRYLAPLHFDIHKSLVKKEIISD